MSEICLVREAGEDDLPKIMKLNRDCFSGTGDEREVHYPEDWYRYPLHSDFFKVFVVEAAGEIVASCSISIIPNISKNGSSYGVIENIVVVPNRKGESLDKAVIEEALRYAQSCQCYKVMLFNNLHQPYIDELCYSMGFEGDSKAGYSLLLE